jgi:transposase InsO family protein
VTARSEQSNFRLAELDFRIFERECQRKHTVDSIVLIPCVGQRSVSRDAEQGRCRWFPICHGDSWSDSEEAALPLRVCHAIRSDNGVPFASPHGLFQLSKLSVWSLRLGISIERIRPGHPQQNGRHERMHFTLTKGERKTAIPIQSSICVPKPINSSE